MSKAETEKTKQPKRFRKTRLVWRLLKWSFRIFVFYRAYQKRQQSRKSRLR